MWWTGKARAACGKEGWHAASRRRDSHWPGAGTASEGTGDSFPATATAASQWASAHAQLAPRVYPSAHDCPSSNTGTCTSRGEVRPAHEHATLITDKQEFLNSIVLSRTEKNERDTAQSFWISFSSNYDSKNILRYKWTNIAVFRNAWILAFSNS